MYHKKKKKKENPIYWLNIYFGRLCHHQELQLTESTESAEIYIELVNSVFFFVILNLVKLGGSLGNVPQKWKTCYKNSIYFGL
jgi:hypothetical protein